MVGLIFILFTSTVDNMIDITVMVRLKIKLNVGYCIGLLIKCHL